MNMPYLPPVKRPSFEGYFHYREIRKERRGILMQLTPIYRVWVNNDFPAMFHSSDGMTYRTGTKFDSDGGSVPSFLQTLRIPAINVKRDSFLPQFFLHDYACDNKGLYVWTGTDWKFQAMTRAKVDWLLRDALLIDANTGSRMLIYGAVRIYARMFCGW